MERHIQTGIGAIVVALLCWVGLTLTSMTESVARLEEKFAGMDRQLALLQQQATNRYTSQDAARDLDAIRKALEDHSQRIRELERGIRKIE